jgi:hypothetical protein
MFSGRSLFEVTPRSTSDRRKDAGLIIYSQFRDNKKAYLPIVVSTSYRGENNFQLNSRPDRRQCWLIVMRDGMQVLGDHEPRWRSRAAPAPHPSLIGRKKSKTILKFEDEDHDTRRERALISDNEIMKGKRDNDDHLMTCVRDGC